MTPEEYKEWHAQRERDTWRWDRLDWPRGLHAGSAGEYRIYEKPRYGEQRFTPQWRLKDTHIWQNWIRDLPGRCSGTDTVGFPSLREAQEWLDEAHLHRPVIKEHRYTPKENYMEVRE